MSSSTLPLHVQHYCNGQSECLCAVGDIKITLVGNVEETRLNCFQQQLRRENKIFFSTVYKNIIIGGNWYKKSSCFRSHIQKLVVHCCYDDDDDYCGSDCDDL